MNTALICCGNCRKFGECGCASAPPGARNCDCFESHDQWIQRQIDWIERHQRTTLYGMAAVASGLVALVALAAIRAVA